MSKNTNNEMVVEWAPFKLAEGVSEARLLEAASELQAGFLARQLGFVRREHLRGKDGQWVDVIYWADRKAADAAMQAAMNSAACLDYFKVMAGMEGGDPGAGPLHFEQVESYD